MMRTKKKNPSTDFINTVAVGGTDDGDNIYSLLPEDSVEVVLNKLPLTSELLKTLPTKRPAQTPIPDNQIQENKRRSIDVQSITKKLEPCEIEAFGKYISSCLYTFTNLQSTLVQRDIQNIITKYKIERLENNALNIINTEPTEKEVTKDEEGFPELNLQDFIREYK